jgi:hypothetical protein
MITKRLLLACTTVAILILSFQNCSKVTTTSSSSPTAQNSVSGGGGVDGMRFSTYGLCADGSIGLLSTIALAPNRQSAQFIRKACQDLVTPQDIDPASFQFSYGQPSTFNLEGTIFDQQTGEPNQPTTIEICQDSVVAPNVQIRIWQDANNLGALYGQVTQINDSSTGALNVLAPGPSTPNQFTSVAGTGNQLTLTLAATGGATLNYSLGGNSSSVTNMICSQQSLPPPPTPSTYNDGTAGAPQGIIQASGALSGYTLRAPWHVPGVDYAVGIPLGTVLKDPTLISMAGITVDSTNKMIRVTGNNLVLDSYDFTLHGGYEIYTIGATNTTVQNSNVFEIETDAQSSGLTVRNCLLDDGERTSSIQTLILQTGSGNLVVQYNWLKGYQADAIVPGASGANVDIRFNLFEDGLSQAGASLYAINASLPYFASATIDYNTFLQHNLSSWGENLAIGSPKNPENFEFGYNTLITLTGGQSTAWMLQMSSGSILTGTVHDNYFDTTGVAGPFYAGISKLALSFSNNFNMVTGAPLPTNP